MVTPKQNLAAAKRIARIISPLLADIASHFAPDVKVSLLVRVPGHDEADIMLGDMSLEDAAALIERRRTSPTNVVIEPGEHA